MDPNCRGFALPPWKSRLLARLNLGMKCKGAWRVLPVAVGAAVGRAHMWGSDGPAPDAPTAADGPPAPVVTGSIQNVLPAPLFGAGATAHMAVAGRMLEGRSRPEGPGCCSWGDLPMCSEVVLLFPLPEAASDAVVVFSSA